MTIPKRTIRRGRPRKLNGKIYKYETASMKKSDAKKKADKLRQQGYLVRVIPAKPLGVQVYSIWIRRKKK